MAYNDKSITFTDDLADYDYSAILRDKQRNIIRIYELADYFVDADPIYRGIVKGVYTSFALHNPYRLVGSNEQVKVKYEEYYERMSRPALTAMPVSSRSLKATAVLITRRRGVAIWATEVAIAITRHGAFFAHAAICNPWYNTNHHTDPKSEENMKKVIAVLLVCLQFTTMAVIAHGEGKPLQFYQETLLPLPEGYVWLGMDVEPSGSLLVLGRHTDGTYALLRWQETEGIPENIPLSDYGESLTAMQVAADGDIMLSTMPQRRDMSEDTIAGSIIWVNPSGEEIARFGIESAAEMPILESLPGRRVALASAFIPFSYLPPAELLVYDDQGIVLYSVPPMAVEDILFDEEILYVFCSGVIHSLSADTGEQMNSNPIAWQHFGRSNMRQTGEMYTADSSGIYKCNLTEGIVEKCIDSLGTSFGGMNAYVNDCSILPDGTFAVAIGDFMVLDQKTRVDDSVFVAMFTPVEERIDRTPFVITRMDNSSYVIQEAASVFQRRHPELDVQLRTFDNFWTGGLTKEDASRVIITELLAVGGGDVIVLDSFPAEPMKKRGMLRDIAHLVSKLSLVPGIAESLQNADGKVYAIPAQFSIPTLMGRDDVVSGIQTFADILEAPVDPYQVRIDASDYTIEEILKMCMGDFLDDQGNVDFLHPDFVSLLEILRQIRIEAEASPATESIASATGGVAMVASMRPNLVFMEAFYTGFGEEEARIIPMPTMHGLSRKYKPEVQLGIPISAKNPELSEEFICLAVSEEMGLDLNESFSTVQSLLDRFFEETIAKNKEKGQRVQYSIGEYTLPSEEYLMGLHALLCEVTEPLPYVDDQVIQFILDELPALFQGTATAEQIAERINQRAFFFLNE